MIERLSNLALSALYQLLVVLGILLLPVAVLARWVGLRVPLHRALDWSKRAVRART